MQELTFTAASTLREAAELLASLEGAIPLAGGTDVLVGMHTGKASPEHLVDLGRIPGLRDIVDTGSAVEIGALSTMTEVSESAVVTSRLPALARAAGLMGCWQVRNLATIGGNLCNAAPSADTAPPLIVYDAVALIEGSRGKRTIPLAEFFTGPGTTVLGKGELLVGLQVPYPPSGFRAAYARTTLRRSMDIPIVNLAAGLVMEAGIVRDARIVLGAVAPTPIRARKTEAKLVGAPLEGTVIASCAAEAAKEAQPITDIRATKEYRAAMVEVLCREALESLVNEEQAL